VWSLGGVRFSPRVHPTLPVRVAEVSWLLVQAVAVSSLSLPCVRKVKPRHDLTLRVASDDVNESPSFRRSASRRHRSIFCHGFVGFAALQSEATSAERMSARRKRVTTLEFAQYGALTNILL
jgi:hypothetical protein